MSRVCARLLLVLILSAGMSARAAAQQRAGTQQVAAELAIDQRSDDDDYVVRVRLRIARGWHIYAPQPGDAGVPSQLKWAMPASVELKSVAWPKPRRRDEDGLTTYAYTGTVEVLGNLRLHGDRALAHGQRVEVAVNWAACSDVCIPQRALLTAILPE